MAHLSTALGCAVALAAGCAAGIAFGVPPGATLHRVEFQSKVANVEYATFPLTSSPPAGVRRSPQISGEIWYGTILRRAAGEGPRESSHSVPFVAEYSLGQPVRAWCDANFNGDLTDDPEAKLSGYPPLRGARSFLTDLRWNARADGRDHPVEWKVRVVLEAHDGSGSAPGARVQRVHAMVGTVALEGAPHRAFLFDGNGDGLYRKDFFDGIFIDLDDNLHFDVDPMSPEFGPLAAPFQMGKRVYEVAEIDPEGRYVSLHEVAEAGAAAPPAVGEPAPEFAYRDTAGGEGKLSDWRGRYVLLNFWASWCGSSADQAPGLREIFDRFHPRGLEVLGISYDTERPIMEEFRRVHPQPWPTTFSGRMFWEDPIGRLYQARWPGALYLIDRDGRLLGTYSDPSEVEARLAELLPAPPSNPGS